MSHLNSDLRTLGQVALKTIVLFQVAIGATANAFLFFHNVSPVLTRHKIKPTQEIVLHLTVANALVLLSSGIPHVTVAFGLRFPLSSLGCKSVYYIRRVARGTSLCSTSVLSTYRAGTLNSMSKGWTTVHRKVSKAIGPFSCSCWVFSVLTSVYTLLKTTKPEETLNATHTQGQWFCSNPPVNAGMVVLWSVSDAVFLSLMVWTSGSMVLLLRSHHHRTQHIHTVSRSHKGLHETRATHTILKLVVTFVAFYALNSVVIFYISAFGDMTLWLIQVSVILASCFPTVSPLLILLRDPKFCPGILETPCSREKM